MFFKRDTFSSMILIIIIFNLSFISTTNAYTINLKNDTLETLIYNESFNYIIQFKEDPVCIYKNKQEIEKTISCNSVLNLKISEYKNRIISNHDNFKDQVNQMMGNNCDLFDIFQHDFFEVFNGIVVKNIDSVILNKIRNLDNIKNIYLDRRIDYCLQDTVPLINADDVWALHDYNGRNITGKGVSVAVIDSGIDYNHCDLADNYVEGFDFVNNDDDPMDDNINSHGTMCSGIISGVAPDVDLYSLKVIDEQGSGLLSDVIAAIELIIKKNIGDIISISLGTDEAGDPTDPLCEAVDNAVKYFEKIVVVSAGNSGNNGLNTISSPGCSVESICVGATHKNDSIAEFSSRGPVNFNGEYIIKPDIVAPGVNIRSTSRGQHYSYGIGTSFSAPHVAGSIALIKQNNPEISCQDVKKILKESSKDLNESSIAQGAGRLDVLAAINLSKEYPIAVLSIPKIISHGIINIYGTAMNGTGDSKDFHNYTLYYNKDVNWIKLIESDKEIFGELLYSWNTSLLESGNYKLKLIVRNKDLISMDIKYTCLGLNKNLIVNCSQIIVENSKFYINITDCNLEPKNALVFLILPFHFPRIRFGSSILFKAPRIFSPNKELIEGKIIVLDIINLKKIILTIKIIDD
jgi:hypothetical protein